MWRILPGRRSLYFWIKVTPGAFHRYLMSDIAMMEGGGRTGGRIVIGRYKTFRILLRY